VSEGVVWFVLRTINLTCGTISSSADVPPRLIGRRQTGHYASAISKCSGSGIRQYGVKRD